MHYGVTEKMDNNHDSRPFTRQSIGIFGHLELTLNIPIATSLHKLVTHEKIISDGMWLGCGAFDGETRSATGHGKLRLVSLGIFSPIFPQASRLLSVDSRMIFRLCPFPRGCCLSTSFLFAQ